MVALLLKWMKSREMVVHHYINDVDSVKVDYNTVSYKNTSDRVFLLSIKELKELAHDKEVDYRAKPTLLAVRNSEYKSNYLDSIRYWWCWLRDAYPSLSNNDYE